MHRRENKTDLPLKSNAHRSKAKEKMVELQTEEDKGLEGQIQQVINKL